VVEVQDGDLVGRGEAEGVYYFDETPSTMIAQVEAVAENIEAGAGRTDLLELMPPGGARHALDAALWDLEAKRAGKRAWELARLPLKEIVTVYSIGLEDEPADQADKAAAAAHQPALKVKLGADRPVQRIEAIRSVRPDATLVVDANQAWSLDQLEEVTPRLAELDQAARRYQMINIKLDKCGGLTHGLEIARAAREKDLGLMVGCMCGTSLAMAPAFVVGLLCDFHDLDGPLLLKNDRAFGMSFENGVVGPPPARLWG